MRPQKQSQRAEPTPFPSTELSTKTDLSRVFLLHEPQRTATLDIVLLTAPFPYFFNGRWSNYLGEHVPHLSDLSERLSEEFPTARLLLVMPFSPAEQETVREECEVLFLFWIANC
jgi:hypothetical protein